MSHNILSLLSILSLFSRKTLKGCNPEKKHFVQHFMSFSKEKNRIQMKIYVLFMLLCIHDAHMASINGHGG